MSFTAAVSLHFEFEAIALEDHYRTVADFTYDWVYWQLADGSLRYVSPSCERITGYSAEQFIKNPDLLTEIVVPEDRSIWQSHHHNVTQEHDNRDIQFRIRRRDGELRWIEHTCRPVVGDQGDSQGIRGSNRDITKRKRAEEALREKQAQLQTIAELAPIVLWTLDRDGLFTLSEGKSLDKLGLIPGEVIGKSVFDLYQEYPAILQDIRRALQGEELAVIHKVGEVIFDTRLTPQKNEQGEIVGLVGASLDITERLQSEEALRLNNFALERTSDAVYWINLTTIIDVNEAACRMLGYSRGEFHGMPVTNIDPSIPEASMVEAWERIKREGSITFETQHKTKAGQIIPVEVIANYIVFEGKELNCCFVRDITERKQAEEMVSSLGLILESSLNEIFIFDAETLRFIHVNQGGLLNLGYSLEELREMTSLDIKPELTQQEFNEIIQPLRDGQQQVIKFTTTHLRKNGTVYPVEVHLQLSTFEDKPAFVAIILDITERKQAEGKLRLNSFALERMTDAVYWVDQDTKIVDVNEAACRMLGYPRKELVGMTLEDINPTYDYSDLDTIWEVVKGGPPPLEIQHKAKDGTFIPVEVLANYIEFEGKKLSCTFARDITERKQTEAALRQSEARYRALIESQIDLISRYRPDTTLTFVNDAYCQFYGKTREELIGQSFTDMVAPEFREAAIQETESLVKSPRLISGEYLNYAADGRECWIHWVVQPIVDENGQTIEIQAVGRDVTQIKETEAALRESEFFLQKSQEVAQTGSYYFDVDTGKWIGSPMLDEIFGIDDNFSKDIDGWIALVHPDQKEEMEQYLNDYVMAKHNRFDKEYRILRHDNQGERWVHGLGELEFDGQGNPIRMIGTIQDVTERKLAEAALRESEERWQFALEGSGDGVWDWNAITNEVFFSRRWKEMLGYTEDEISNHLDEWDKRVHSDDKEQCYADLNRHFNGEVPYYQNEHRVMCKDGSYKWILDRGKVISWTADRKPLRVIGTHTDITGRKQAEEELEKHRHHLEELVEERSTELALAYQRLQELDQLKDEFIASISHELRTPITNLKVYLRLLNLKPKKKDLFISTLQHETRRLEQIIEGILFVSQLVQDLKELKVTNVDLNVLANMSITNNLPKAQDRDLELIFNGEVGLPPVQGSQALLAQVMNILLSNALNYTPAKGCVVVGTRADQLEGDRWVSLCVRNTGVVIPDDELPHLFERFFRGQVALNAGVPGAGLGLYIAKEIVERHGGQIEVESGGESGEGVEFTVWLPATPVDA